MDICSSMMQERKRLEQVVAGADLRSKDDAVAYADALTRLIWNHNLLGMVHSHYDEKAVYKGANGHTVNTQDGIIGEMLRMQAAFPDMRVRIDESFATGDATAGFTVYQRSYCQGTHLGTTHYGPPTGRVLDDSNSMGQTVYVFKHIGGQWKVVSEFSLRSQVSIEKLLKGET